MAFCMDYQYYCVLIPGDLSASEITMSDDDRIELMILVKEGKLSMHDAVEMVGIAKSQNKNKNIPFFTSSAIAHLYFYPSLLSAESHVACIFYQSQYSQYPQNICKTFVQFWTSVEAIGPTLYKCYTNVSCLLGCLWISVQIKVDNESISNGELGRKETKESIIKKRTVQGCIDEMGKGKQLFTCVT